MCRKEVIDIAISYNKLWKLLIDKKLNKTYLRNNGIHPASISRMSKDEKVSLEVLENICRLLDCNIGDIIDYIPDDE